VIRALKTRALGVTVMHAQWQTALMYTAACSTSHVGARRLASCRIWRTPGDKFRAHTRSLQPNRYAPPYHGQQPPLPLAAATAAAATAAEAPEDHA